MFREPPKERKNGKVKDLARTTVPAQPQTEVRIVFNEAGSVGLKTMEGFVSEAYNSSLYWPNVQPLYSRLRTSMPEMVMIRRAFTAWARAVEPIIDMPDKPSDADREYKEFLLSEFDNMEGGFTALLETMVNHVPFFGWGWWEAVPGVRDPNWKPPNGDTWRSEEDDGLIGIRRLSWRDTSTFYGWVFNDRKRVIAMKQVDYPNPEIVLPLSQSLHLTFGDPNNPEGSSPLEAVWRLERIRYGLEVIMGIGFEHSAGYLNVTKKEGGTLSDEDKRNIEVAARNILTAKEGNYAAWPPGVDGEVKDIGFQAANAILNSIRHYSLMALSVYMMQFVGLNTMTNTGALASASDASQMAIFTFNSMMDGFASQYDWQIGRRLWGWNKDSFPGVTARPIIRFSHVDKNVPLGELGDFLVKMKDVLPLGTQDYIAIRKRSDFLPESLPADGTMPTPPTATPEPVPTQEPAPTEPAPPAPTQEDKSGTTN